MQEEKACIASFWNLCSHAFDMEKKRVHSPSPSSRQPEGPSLGCSPLRRDTWSWTMLTTPCWQSTLPGEIHCSIFDGRSSRIGAVFSNVYFGQVGLSRLKNKNFVASPTSWMECRILCSLISGVLFGLHVGASPQILTCPGPKGVLPLEPEKL